jgi:glycosyltransferase involved in cell wall biosynthesis
VHKIPNRITCNFFTNDIQVSFVQNEIKYLAGSFHKVNVYYLIKSEYNEFPKNVYLQYINQNQCNSREITKKYFFSIFNVVLREIFIFPKHLYHFKLFLNDINRLIRTFYLYEIIFKDFNIKSTSSVFYTFWFNDWATALSIAVNKNKINNFYTRAHGTDLFEERVPITKHISFRKFQLQHVTKLFSVSNKGSEYLKNKYPYYEKKIRCIYLGTINQSMNPLNYEKTITIVSCATIRNIKRIYLIPEILKTIKHKVIWYHIGGENVNDPSLIILKENIKYLPENIKHEFKGSLSNEEVFEFYKSTPVDIFISVSETEGLPVSMMEAISFGIPIISTDVGGCNEIVNEETGVLIPLNFNPIEVAYIIIEMKNKYGTIEKRNKIKGFWKSNFDAQTNFKKIISNLEI